ncbi:hypothetical protein Tco_0216992 [Tanacetum coccineum]
MDPVVVMSGQMWQQRHVVTLIVVVALGNVSKVVVAVVVQMMLNLVVGNLEGRRSSGGLYLFQLKLAMSHGKFQNPGSSEDAGLDGLIGFCVRWWSNWCSVGGSQGGCFCCGGVAPVVARISGGRDGGVCWVPGNWLGKQVDGENLCTCCIDSA